APARALGSPDEPFAILQEIHRRRVFGPARQPLLTNDAAAFSSLGVAGGELHDVLSAVGPVAEQFPSVRRPQDVIDVMADDGISERLSFAHINLSGFLSFQVVDEQIGDWIGRARFRIGLDVHSALELGLIELQEVIRYGTLVEAIESDLLAVRGPPDRGDLSQLFAVNPARCSILDSRLLIAVRRNGDLIAAVGVAQPQIAVTVEGFQLFIRREGRIKLSPALEAARPPMATSGRARRRRIILSRRRYLHRRSGGDRVVISFAVSPEF